MRLPDGGVSHARRAARRHPPCRLPVRAAGVAIGLAALEWLSPVSALHVLTVGAIGNMTLAIMTRATLGHTGRELNASRFTVATYLVLLAAALLRPIAEIVPDYYQPLISLAGVAWMLAFGMFLVEYGPMLLTPRVKSKAEAYSDRK